MVRHAEWLAPVVRIRRTGRLVFLLAWERDERGQWNGHVAWLAREYVAWRGVDVWMPGQDLVPVEGEDYSGVPRAYEAGPF